MPGRFSLDARPRMPGAYVNFEAEARPVVLPSIGSVVAVPFTHDWGPFQRSVLVGTLAEFEDIYGTSRQTPGYIAVKQAFQGEATPGRGGAGAVLCYRTGGTAAKAATLALLKVGGGTGLTVDARYPGLKGNSINITVQDYASDATKTELIVFLGTTRVESYVFADTDITDAVAKINGSSHWISATLGSTGTALATVSSATLATGNDGSTLAAGDWTDVMDALSTQRFGILAPYDLTDTGILASLLVWAQDLNAVGKRFSTVVGGELDEALADAVDRAESLNDPNFLTIGIGSIEDSGMRDVDGNPTVLSTSQFAPRVAGAYASRGEALNLTYARFAGVDLLNGATPAQVADAYDAGVMVFEKDSSPFPVRIAKATTTYVVETDGNEPVEIFREPKFMRTMQTFETEITEYAEQNVIGLLPVNDKTRAHLVGEGKKRARAREHAGVIQPGATVRIATNPPPSDDDDFIAIDYGFGFGRSVEQLFNTIRVH